MLMTSRFNRQGVKGFHMTHLNARSLSSTLTFDLFKTFLLDTNICVASVSETWLTTSIPNSHMYIPGYTISRVDRAHKTKKNKIKKGGGLACYIKSGVIHSTTELEHLNSSTKNLEVQWILIDDPSMKDMVIANVYRPPDGNVKDFIKDISDKIDLLGRHRHKEIFIMGDMNIDLLTRVNDKKDLMDFAKLIGCKQYITKPTRSNKKTTTLIDLIFSNSEHITDSGVHTLNVSDHDLIYITRYKEPRVKEKASFEGRSYNKYNKDHLRVYLTNDDWGIFWNTTNPDDSWDILEGKITKFLDDCCPIKNFTFSVKKDPWISNELIRYLKEKDSLLRKAKRTGNEDDWNIAVFHRNRAKRLVALEKKEYFDKLLKKHKNDSKKYWNTINSLFKPKQGTSQFNLINQLNKTKIDMDKTADFINDFFIKIGPKLAEKYKLSWTPPKNSWEVKFDLQEIDNEEIVKIINSIDTSKSSAVPNISSQVLKDVFQILPDHLLRIINQSIRMHIIPQKWKEATVVPLPKEGDPTDVNNLRPISTLPLPSKILERVIHTQTSKYLYENSVLTKHQSGFRKNHSTISAIADFTDDIYKALNHGNITHTIFIDFSKAFDTINHEILIKKLTFLRLH